MPTLSTGIRFGVFGVGIPIAPATMPLDIFAKLGRIRLAIYTGGQNMVSETQKQSPFYKSFAFWLSLAALGVSTLSLIISFLNSPYFGCVGADIVYYCEEDGPNAKSFPVFITNRGNAPAEDVIVTIRTMGSRNARASVARRSPKEAAGKLLARRT